jgi:hypothetical protein
MKTIIFFSMLLGMIFSVSLVEAAITCNNCVTGFCVCTVTDFSAGYLDVYTRSNCLSTPIYEQSFSNGVAKWYPEDVGTYYLQASSIDKATKSTCYSQTVSTPCSSCTADSCSCSISICLSGTFDIYTKSDCTGPSSHQFSFSNSGITWQPENTGDLYFIASCQDKVTKSFCTKFMVSSASVPSTTTSILSPGGPSGCRAEAHVCTPASPCCQGLKCVDGLCKRVPVTTTTIKQTTTTIVGKKECPYECCENENQYKDKECPEKNICTKNKCVPLVDNREVVDYKFYYIIIAILIIFIPSFTLFFIFKKKQTDWKKLYEKWSARPQTRRNF